ncbi:SusC/RagA family TonB-linked outer membrane protein [Chitinophaga japonensis]|uniref:TonB-linked SusC/RagA family outer membrane protein n=1 Tax=Chitinophaga japonensis TaxID=104662 RepID=A0A562SL58_CHIJA|nr:TonB-dependent receptor [Chitinophaga japonensis]TWI81962.1 TonB-linked SusC/RagA family outer membrane protein [Chitinophaga japonensis]
MKYILYRRLICCALLLLQHFYSHAFQSGPDISGRVLDAQDRTPLPGVNVRIKGSNNGVATGADGRFTLPAAQGAVLVFTYVGYETKEVTVTSTRNMTVPLSKSNQDLNEVLVVGYGTQKKANVTGAIATLNAQHLDERPIARVDQALVGQMAGVQVKQTSGAPGKGFQVKVRGTGSINAGTEPLYVIDGFPLDVSSPSASGNFAQGSALDNINPNDIASIQVLKDASAAAIYGSRAANGVVIITTRSGKSGRNRMEFNTYVGWQETVKKIDMLSAEEWIDRAREIIDYNYVNPALGRLASDNPQVRREKLGGFDFTRIYDERWYQPGHPGLRFVNWQDELFRKGLVQSYQLAASGGTDRITYRISGDYLNQEGIVIHTGYKRYSFRSNVNLKANERINLGLNIATSYSAVTDPGAEGKDQQLHKAVSATPIVEDSVGLETGVVPNPRYAWASSTVSPVAVLREQMGEERSLRTLGSFYGDYRILDGLVLKATLNLDNTDYRRKYFSPSIIRNGNPGSGSSHTYRKTTLVNENTLSYNKRLGNHDIAAVAGYAYNQTNFEEARIGGSNYSTDDIYTLNGATTLTLSGTYTRETKNVLISWFGRVQYGYRDKYLLSASIRRDGSSRFGNNTKWGVFPAVSAGWRILEEPFMKGLRNVSELKLRASWGHSGNNNIGDFSQSALLGFANYVLGTGEGALVKGQVPSNIPNPDLGWEKSETIDAGLDLGLFDNRIYASFDYYRKLNTDLLLSIPVAAVTGFSTAITNIGQVENKGWELELSTRNLTGALGWSTSINFSHNANKVLQLGPNNTPIIYGNFDNMGHHITTVGQPIGAFYVIEAIGVLKTAEEAASSAIITGEEAGDPKYRDANGDKVIDVNDAVIMGQPDPKYVWGITNNFTYKGFDFSFLFQGQWGNKIYSTFGRAIDRQGSGVSDNSLGIWANRWRSEADPGNGIVPKAWPIRYGRLKDSRWLYNAAYIRLRTVTLGYDLARLLKHIPGVNGGRIYLSAENAWGKDYYDGGFNPEAINDSGDDYGAFPLAKSFVLGLNISF